MPAVTLAVRGVAECDRDVQEPAEWAHGDDQCNGSSDGEAQPPNEGSQPGPSRTAAEDSCCWRRREPRLAEATGAYASGEGRGETAGTTAKLAWSSRGMIKGWLSRMGGSPTSADMPPIWDTTRCISGDTVTT